MSGFVRVPLILFIQLLIFVIRLTSLYALPSSLIHNGHLRVQRLLDKISVSFLEAWKPGREKYVYWLHDGSGWGNQCRGISASLALALVSGRRLVLEDRTTYFHLFEDPTSQITQDAGKLSYESDMFDSNAPKDVASVKNMERKFNPNMTINAQNVDHFRAYVSSKDTNEYTHGRLGIDTEDYADQLEIVANPEFSKPVISHKCGCSFTMHFLQPKYHDVWYNIFDETLRYDEIEVLLLMWLFRNPKARLVENANKLKAQIGWDTHAHRVMVQYRTWAEVKFKVQAVAKAEKGTMSCYLEDALAYRALIPANESLLLYVTGDTSKAVATAVRALNGSIPNTHVVSAASTVAAAAVAAGGLFENFHSAQIGQEHRNIDNLGMIDWFLMGQADVAICSGSTYCVAARARTGIGRSDYSYRAASSSSSSSSSSALLSELKGENVRNDHRKKRRLHCDREDGGVGRRDVHRRASSTAANMYRWQLPIGINYLADAHAAPFEDANSSTNAASSSNTTYVIRNDVLLPLTPSPPPVSSTLSVANTKLDDGSDSPLLAARFTTICPRNGPNIYYVNAVSLPHRPLPWYRSNAMGRVAPNAVPLL